MTRTEKGILASLVLFLFVGIGIRVFLNYSSRAHFTVVSAEEVSGSEKMLTQARSELVKVDLNLGETMDFEKLPGVGRTLAQAIVKHRKASGPFKKVEEILQVSGFGKGRYKKLWEYMHIAGQPGPEPATLFRKIPRARPKTEKEKSLQQRAGPEKVNSAAKVYHSVNLNDASAEKIMTLPRVGKKLAQRIIQYRELYGPFLVPSELFEVEGMSENLYSTIEPYIYVK